MVLPKSGDTCVQAALSFAGHIDHRTLLDASAAIFPTQRDMHCQIETPEGLAAFGRAPDHDKALARDDAPDQIGGCEGEDHLVEGYEVKPVLDIGAGCIAGLRVSATIFGF